MYLIAENFGSTIFIFIWLQQKKIPRVIKTCTGQKGRDMCETFTFEPGDEMKLVPVLHKFPEYCNPQKNITILRHKFFTYRQQEGQNFHDFVTELKKLSSECDIDNLQVSPGFFAHSTHSNKNLKRN